MRIDVAELAKVVGSDPTIGGYRFGVGSAVDVAKVLHQFAEDVGNGMVLLQEAEQVTRVKRDDFTERSIIIRYVEKVLPKE